LGDVTVSGAVERNRSADSTRVDGDDVDTAEPVMAENVVVAGIRRVLRDAHRAVRRDDVGWTGRRGAGAALGRVAKGVLRLFGGATHPARQLELIGRTVFDAVASLGD